MNRCPAGAIAVLVSLGAAAPALAHIRLDVPQNRYNDQKNGPCGAAQDQRTDRVTVYEPGETITVEWEETIDHPSHYRISFSARGTEDFADPTDFDDYYTNDAVLLDEIVDRDGGGRYSAEVTLPDEPCDDCTLQLLQVMYDKSFENAFYWQCADIELREGGGEAPGVDAGAPPTGGGGGGCASTGAAGTGGAPLAVIVVGYVARARRVRAG